MRLHTGKFQKVMTLASTTRISPASWDSVCVLNVQRGELCGTRATWRYSYFDTAALSYWNLDDSIALVRWSSFSHHSQWTSLNSAGRVVQVARIVPVKSLGTTAGNDR